MTKEKGDQSAGLLDYLSEAFRFRWNLLFFLGASVAGAISPVANVAIPVILAGELLYLTGLISIPRFRAAVDAKVHARNRRKRSHKSQVSPASRTLSELLDNLSADLRERFLKLRKRCLDMQGIAQGVRGESSRRNEADEVRTPALDRLLWVFLKLLRSQQSLSRFLTTTDEDAIQARLEQLGVRREALTEASDERLRRSLVDDIATTELRLDNYRKAEKNAEFVDVELDRIEGKIQALTEVMVSNQDPDYISSQVDSVAESMKHTEEAIRELNSITGLRDELDSTPEILESEIYLPEVAET